MHESIAKLGPEMDACKDHAKIYTVAGVHDSKYLKLEASINTAAPS